MESRVNYIVVGMFVVLFGVGLAAFVFWLEKYGVEENFKYYKTHMTESVSGLSQDASVKYRGVDVGIVETIRINPENSEEVEIVLRVKKETPIKEDMVAVLKFYGLTGLAFIEIEGGSKESPLIVSQKDEIPIIKSAPSTFTRLNEALPNIAKNLSAALAKIEALLNEKNLVNIQQSINNIKEISLYLKNHENELNTLLSNSTIVSEEAILFVHNAASAAEAIKLMANSIEKSVQRGDYNIKEMTSDTFNNTDNLLDQLQNLTAELEVMVQSIQRNPREFFLKQTTPKLGPGEITNNE